MPMCIVPFQKAQQYFQILFSYENVIFIISLETLY